MNDRRRVCLLTAVVAFAVVVFIVDLLTPHAVAEWVLYLPLPLAAVWFNKPRQVLGISAFCSVLIVGGFFSSHPEIEFSWAVANRAFGLIALWLMTYASNALVTRSLQLMELASDLQQEIARRKQTEQALRENEERLRLAMQGVGMGTWDVNLETGKVLWSETQFRIFGYEPAPAGEASREMWLSRIYRDDRRRVLEAEEHARNEHTRYQLEYRIRRPDSKKTVWIAVFGHFHYDEKGKAIRLLGVCFDITRRKELENEVLEIAAREQRQIGQELHDGVGQELTGLGLMAQSLAQRLPETAAERRIATRLIAGLDQTHQKVRELSRGLIPVHVEARGLPAALDDLAARVTEQSGIAVTWECPEWVEMPDHRAATQMFRIAQEAVTNALRHGRPRQIRLTLLSEPDGLRLRIKDDGIGMQMGTEESYGLGLRIMHYRAALIGGVLQIGSSIGGGTIVTCTLPRSKNHDERESGSLAGRGENLDRG